MAEAYNFIKKETLGQVFSCEFYKSSKNTPPMAASEVSETNLLGDLIASF